MRHWKLTLAACLAGCVLFAAAVSHSAQRLARSGKGGGNSPCADKPGSPGTSKVQPVDPTPEQSVKIAALIEQLGAPTLRDRDTAMSALAEFGAAAIKQVKEAQAHDDDEIGHRCTILLEVLYSGKAELFLAARRLGMTDKELEQKLASPDPSLLLQTLEQNAGAGMAPIWARVLAALATAQSRYPAALTCRRAEGLAGYGAVLAKAARDPETRKIPQRSAGIVALVSLLPPQRAEHVVLTLASLTAAEDPLNRAVQIDDALRTARALRGIYDAASCLQSVSEENEKLIAGLEGASPERLLLALALALTPAASEGQLGAARLPATSAMNLYELSEFAALCARSNLITRLRTLLAELRANDSDFDRRASIVAQALARCGGEAAFDSFDGLPPAAQLAMFDTWWFNPPAATKMQPFLCGKLASTTPAIRTAAAALLAGYRAPSSASALAVCALAFADTAPQVMAALAPMADLLPAAAPKALAELIRKLESADAKLRAPLIDLLSNCQSGEASAALTALWRKNLPLNELGPAMRFFSRDQGSAPGVYCAACLLWASRYAASESAYLSQNLTHSEWTLLRTLLGCDDAAGFALLEALAQDAWAEGSGESMIALALANKDAALAPELARLYGAGNDPRAGYLQQYLAISRSAAGEEFRSRARKLTMESPDLVALVVAVNYGRGGTITRESLLTALAEKPDNYDSLPPLARLMAAGELPAPFLRALGTHALLDRDTNYPLLARDEALLLQSFNLDVVSLLYGTQPQPMPRTPTQLVATAALGGSAAAEIIARAEVSKDGANFEWRECARAFVGLTPQPLAQAVLRSQTAAPFRIFTLLRSAREGQAWALRTLLDSYTPRGFWHESAGFAWIQGGSRYRGDDASHWGAAAAAASAAQPLESGALAAPLVRSLLGQEFNGEFATWWSSRRGLLELDAATGKLRLTELK